MRRLLIILLLASALFPLTGCADSQASALSVVDAEVMLAPPGVSVTAALMTVKNDSDQSITIERIEAEDFEHVELHKTEVVDGTARMIAQKNLTIPAGGTLELAHGGYHLMLYAPARGFAEGDVVKLTLYTSAGRISVNAPVKRLSL
ncbi:MAG: copper chaperone PCu(A)C [Gammaproteobacteria bacterium]|nr:copper chaperone PCu(A)C [Gammaproteobacteria bacterium]